MEYIGEISTDVGIYKKKNQDSSCIKIAQTKDRGQVAMVLMCDGMGGLEKGELASAVVISSFSNWFEKELPKKISSYSVQEIAKEWLEMIQNLNEKILAYGNSSRISLGTTLSALLILEEEYLIVHVGDSRVYRISDKVEQLTEDHTFVAREIKQGRMTLEEAKRDPRRNALLQCVGASKRVVPDVITGRMEKDMVFMLCTDGFYHVLKEEEIQEAFEPEILESKEVIKKNGDRLIEQIKSRQEKDNITVAVIKKIG